ncbi:MAG TPA: hypothetical protein VF994_08065, partial [Myxococcales bacterium]|nr:hypothetical protein [Gemmatimonadales bacterium]
EGLSTWGHLAAFGMFVAGPCLLGWQCYRWLRDDECPAPAPVLRQRTATVLKLPVQGVSTCCGLVVTMNWSTPLPLLDVNDIEREPAMVMV